MFIRGRIHFLNTLQAVQASVQVATCTKTQIGNEIHLWNSKNKQIILTLIIPIDALLYLIFHQNHAIKILIILRSRIHKWDQVQVKPKNQLKFSMAQNTILNFIYMIKYVASYLESV